MYQIQEIDPQLSGWFEAIGETPPMDEQRRCELRGNFLAQAQRIALTAPRQAPRRQDGWVLQLRSIFNQPFGRKPSLQFAAVLATLLIMLIFAGGLTTYAAQSSLPDQPLYPLKLWSEAVRLKAAGSGQDWQLALQFAERRAAEISQMVVNGHPMPVTLQMRLMLQMDKALQLAVSRPDDEARQALEQVRRRFEEQEQEMVMLQGGFGPQADAALIRARETIRERIRWAESGIQEPNQLREHFRLGLQKPEITPGAQEQHRYSGTAAPGGPKQYGAGECPDCTPQGPQNGGNPWTTGTPTPGSGYGEGQGGNPWTTGTPTPGSGYGEGQGGNPWTTSTPTPGSGYGPGPGPNPTSTPPSQTGPGSGQNSGNENTPQPGNNPGSGSGTDPTNEPGSGSGSHPTETNPGGGGQPGQGGSNT